MYAMRIDVASVGALHETGWLIIKIATLLTRCLCNADSCVSWSGMRKRMILGLQRRREKVTATLVMALLYGILCALPLLRTVQSSTSDGEHHCLACAVADPSLLCAGK